MGDRVELPDRPRATRGVVAPELLRQGLRFFAAPKGQPRARRGTDVVLLVPSLLGVGAVIAAYPEGPFERSLERFFASVPGWLDPVWRFLADSLWLWAAVLVLASLARRRFAVVAVALATCALAGLAALVAARLALGAWPNVGDSILGTSAGTRFPHVRSAAAVAAILAISPHFVRPLRTLSSWIVLCGDARRGDRRQRHPFGHPRGVPHRGRSRGRVATRVRDITRPPRPPGRESGARRAGRPRERARRGGAAGSRRVPPSRRRCKTGERFSSSSTAATPPTAPGAGLASALVPERQRDDPCGTARVRRARGVRDAPRPQRRPGDARGRDRGRHARR